MGVWGAAGDLGVEGGWVGMVGGGRNKNECPTPRVTTATLRHGWSRFYRSWALAGNPVAKSDGPISASQIYPPQVIRKTGFERNTE